MTDNMQDMSIDEIAEQDVEAQAEPAKTEYIEFVGDVKYGTEFTGRHRVSDKHMKKFHHVDLGKKEVSWTKRADGRMLVPTSDITPEAAEVLANDPMFKRVEL
jgi:hypothetical protein